MSNCSRAAISTVRSTASPWSAKMRRISASAAQALFGVGLRRGAKLLHPQPLADAGQDIGQPPPCPVMHQRSGGGDGLHSEVTREPFGGGEAGLSCPS
jgi:hypothetical protein